MPKKAKKKYFQPRRTEPAAAESTAIAPPSPVATPGAVMTRTAPTMSRPPGKTAAPAVSHTAVTTELKRIAILTVIIVVILVALAFFLR